MEVGRPWRRPMLLMLQNHVDRTALKLQAEASIQKPYESMQPFSFTANTARQPPSAWGTRAPHLHSQPPSRDSQSFSVGDGARSRTAQWPETRIWQSSFIRVACEPEKSQPIDSFR